MAKKEKLSLDELLEQALVKDEDKPYDVPDNWIWTTIDSLFEVTSSKRVFKEEWKSVGVPFYRTRELAVLCEKSYVENELFITEEMYEEYKEKYGVPSENDLLVSGVGTIGKAYVVRKEDKFYFKDGNIIWFKNIAKVNAKYISYLYKSNFMINQVHDFSSGTTVDTYTIVNAKKTAIPLPPLPEQQRIVNLIESIFEKLDRAKELVQNAFDSFENRKSAILHKAFIGELTAKWREEHGVDFEKDWEERKLSEVCSLITDGTHQTPQYADSGYVFLSSKNVTTGKIDWDNVKYIPQELHEKLYSRLAPQLNDILLAKNGTTGVAAIVDRDCIFDIYVSLALLRPKEMVLPAYLLHAINNPITKDKFNHELTGIGVPNLHLRDIRETTIPVPPLLEQIEIVKILDNLIDNEKKAKELYDVTDKIEHMKKSILARAFRGELNTNNPDEASALELMKDIIGSK